ncbi:MCE family protein [Mycolicibacterium diernhoferi]|uniref:Mammalian cell entry protein n=1 Tax=Mycolicibacterium diernhoferi TaxID=1801 RepID=A0A1Q4HDJ1_9MYCO|nr:MCE family protein [Mycolicibacterium diernhoferi]OJZ65481.1 mammalian cell entry protein [Mycolicibacterium diernhoferi]OPE53221.1 mammalian cell entry protein [Mycolicibacterium diernhoferi]PEG51931.1 mammalian cell entry protein [Mycolicibacterium diernhoferi]QYL22220.1 MCE family protein [Mycolicibacterium diernhoferi]
MTQTDPKKSKWLRGIIAVALAVLLAVGVYLVWPNRGGNKIVAYFPTAVGLYPGDEVRVVGVPVGRIDAIEPRATDVKISMTVQGDVRVPADARALIIAPNLVSARFVQLTPAYTGGDVMASGAEIGMDRTAVPVEWDEVKEQLTALSAQLGPKEGGVQGPLTAFVNQAADTFDGNGDSFRQALRELSQTAGRLGDSRTDLFGTVRNLQVLVDALANSNEQIVQFTNHVSSVSQVLASSSQDLDNTLGVLNQALGDVKGLLGESNGELIESVGKLADFTQILTDHSDDIEQILHITPNGLANFYNIYNPAQGTVGGLLSLPNFANPVQFICGGTFDTGASPDNYKRAEICRQRMGPVLKRITMNYPPMLLHPVDSITAYKGQIIYDTPATEAKARTPVPYLQWQPAPGVTPPTVGPEGNLSELILPPPAVVGQISPAGPAPSQMSPAGAAPGQMSPAGAAPGPDAPTTEGAGG